MDWFDRLKNTCIGVLHWLIHLNEVWQLQRHILFLQWDIHGHNMARCSNIQCSYFCRLDTSWYRRDTESFYIFPSHAESIKLVYGTPIIIPKSIFMINCGMNIVDSFKVCEITWHLSPSSWAKVVVSDSCSSDSTSGLGGSGAVTQLLTKKLIEKIRLWKCYNSYKI